MHRQANFNSIDWRGTYRLITVAPGKIKETAEQAVQFKLPINPKAVSIGSCWWRGEWQYYLVRLPPRRHVRRESVQCKSPTITLTTVPRICGDLSRLAIRESAYPDRAPASFLTPEQAVHLKMGSRQHLEHIRHGPPRHFSEDTRAHTKAYAESLDAEDPLRYLRNEFLIPTKQQLVSKTLPLPGTVLFYLPFPYCLLISP